MRVKHLVLVGLTTVMMAACGSNSKIVKTWTLDNMDASAALAELPKEAQAQAKASMDQMAATQKGKMVFDIQKDGKLVATVPGMDGKSTTMKGTWKLSEDNKTLTTVMDGKTEKINIKELTDDKLVFEIPEQKMSMIFVPKK